MMRLLNLGLVITAFIFWALTGCGDDDGGDYYDAGTDADGDTDTDHVPIELPEALIPSMIPNDVMTGPISPPPEDEFGDGLSGDGPESLDPTSDEDLQDETHEDYEIEDTLDDNLEIGEELDDA
jgi:hypothetical protein